MPVSTNRASGQVVAATDINGIASLLNSTETAVAQKVNATAVGGVMIQLIWTGTAYPTKAGPSGAFYTFVGPSDPNALGLMVDGDSWRNTAP